MDVYPSGRWGWTNVIGFGVLSFVFVIGAISAIGDGVTGGDWWVLAGLVFLPWILWRATGQLRHPLPLAHLDEKGIDCALGHIPWTDVANAAVAWHWIAAGRGSHPSRRLFLGLRNPAEAPAPVAREYLSGAPFGGPIESDGKIRVPVWGSKKKVLADLGRYYPAA